MKKIIFLILLIFMVLPYVSANDDAVYVGQNTTVDGQGTIDDPYSNLNLALSNAFDNSTILINDGIYSGSNNSKLIISKNNLLIKANGDVTFTGSNIFTNNGNNLTLSGLKFVNCTDNVIWNNKKLNVYNLSFYNNRAEDAACIESVRGATLNVDSCLFVENEVTVLDGGAVSNKGFGSITNSVFIKNHAHRDGGAVRNYGGILTINNCTFINNTAYGDIDDSYGGAVYHWIGTINISECLFLNNYAPDCGGAIHICKGRMVTAYANMTIYNNVFINNSAKEGGAILLEGCEGKVFNNVFLNNTKNTIFLSDYFKGYFNSTIDDNWWGENSPDWNNTIKNLEIPSSVVTLNLTVNPNILMVNESANYHYGFYVGENEVDIPKRNVIVSSSGGNLSDTSFKSLTEGKFTISVGADNQISSVEVIVDNNSAILTVDDVEKYFSGSERLIVKLMDSNSNPIKGANVTITINSRTYLKTTNENGITSLALKLNSGIYQVTTTYGYHTTKSTVTVKNTVSGSDIVKIYRNNTQYNARFLDGEGNCLAYGTNVTFNINGVFYNRSVKNDGIARLNINLEQGNYTLTALNPITGENTANNISVLPSITDNHDLVKYYKNDSQYLVRILDSSGNSAGAGKVVVFNINGIFYNRTTNSDGIARLNIKLPPGNYTITAEYNGCKVSNQISVLNVMYAQNLVKKYNAPDQFKVLLLDGNGNPYPNQNITFNINGVLYIRTTNLEGIARLNIWLQSGEYIITSTYNGYAILNTIKVEEI